MSEKVKIYSDAIEEFGEDLQFVVAMEECAELIQALSKVIRSKASGSDYGMKKLAEEVADVHIMLEQLKVVIDGHGVWDVENIIKSKLFRLRNRIIEARGE